jgi:TPR repeat protein
MQNVMRYFGATENIKETIKMFTEINSAETWEKLLSEAKNGNNLAQFEVGIYYENGIEIDGVEIIKANDVEGFNWTKKAYENGNLKALVSYADYLSLGKSCEKNLDLAIELYKKGIELGISEASYNLAIEYRNQQNFEKAFEYYEKANELDSNYEEFTIAKCYYYGIGIEKNKNKAFELLKKIKFPQNNQFEVDEANYLIGIIHLEGEIVEKSIELARKYLELANIDEDHHSAQELLLIIGRSENLQ